MNDNFWSTTFWTITIALLIGAGAGILATSYTSSYLSDYALELSKLTAPLRLKQPDPKQFPSSLADALHRFTNNNVPSLVTFYPASGRPPLGYRADDALATGLILTSDGWILAPKETQGRYTAMVVAIGDQVYPVENVIAEPQTGMVFLKVKAESLNIVGFGSGLAVAVAEQVLVADRSSTVQVKSVYSISSPQGIATSSDSLYRTFVLEGAQSKPAFVFSLNGDFVGVVSSSGDMSVVTPVEKFLPVFRTFLETGSVQRPSLGLSTISIAHTVGLDEKTRRSRMIGALIADRKSITPKSSAEIAGLKSLDILLSYNGQLLNEDQTLDELVAQSKPGEAIVLRVDRAGEEMEVSVTLGDE